MRRRATRSAGEGARARLRQFRHATIVAVAVTGFLLLLVAPEEAGIAQDTFPADSLAADTLPAESRPTAEPLSAAAETIEVEVRADSLARASAQEAAGTLRNLWNGFVGNLPKYGIALAVLGAAALLVRLLRRLLRMVLRQWERADAVTALSGVVLWLLALGIAMSVLVGDIRALVGSVGLVGLALSWALQTPIESFTGWLLNSFQGYYRVGDRIAVGDTLGDVYRIDLLTTTLWEIGGPDRPGYVHAEQPTGRLITVPNSEVLAGSIVNYTRDFPFVWDELAVPVANESDIGYAAESIRRVATSVLGDYMAEPARTYEVILRTLRLETSVAAEPQVFISLDDSWTNLVVRYLVGARERRKWKSALAMALLEDLNRPEQRERIRPVYPRRQIQVIGPDGEVAEAGWLSDREAPGAGADRQR